MYDILENYVLSHPGAQPRDIIKFCYQSLLGPGHMAPERAKAAAFVNEELERFGRRMPGEPEIELLEGGRPGSTSTAAFRPKALPPSSA